MPQYAEHQEKWYRVAIIGYEHEDGDRLVEWLEGPRHEERCYVRQEDLRDERP